MCFRDKERGGLPARTTAKVSLVTSPNQIISHSAAVQTEGGSPVSKDKSLTKQAPIFVKAFLTVSNTSF